MKRLSLILVVGLLLTMAVVAQSSPREEGAGSSFMTSTEADSLNTPAVIEQNPGMSSDGNDKSGSYLAPVAADVGSNILIQGLDTPEAHQ
jgi:hypothetical protein